MYSFVHGSSSPESGARHIKIFFPELVTVPRRPVNDTLPPRPHPVSAFNVISRSFG
jgi:hypothetical protein